MNVYVQNWSGPSNGILHRFCLTGGSTLTSQDQVPWFMYQNRLKPSGGIYYLNFVPCFVVLYLNNMLLGIKKSIFPLDFKVDFTNNLNLLCRQPSQPADNAYD